MAWEDLKKDASGGRRDKLIGVFIGVLAVVLAVCAMGGDNADQDAMLANVESSNTWAFFQAKNARRQALRLQIDDFEALLAANPGIAEDEKRMLAGKIATYRATDKELTSEPRTGEGLDELFVKGKALEKVRDEALQKGPYFDYGQALLQIAIVLASIAIISGGNALLFGSVILGGLGVLATFGGFTLAFSLPF